MPVSVFSAAHHLCNKSGWALSNLKLQKIIYLAHMVHLGEKDQQLGLVSEPFEAWDYGPVSPDLYRHVRAFGSSPIRNVFHGCPAPSDPEVLDSLDSVYDQVGHLTAGQLVRITHRKGGAWDTHYIPGAMGIGIPNDAILREYQDLAASQAAAPAAATA